MAQPTKYVVLGIASAIRHDYKAVNEEDISDKKLIKKLRKAFKKYHKWDMPKKKEKDLLNMINSKESDVFPTNFEGSPLYLSEFGYYRDPIGHTETYEANQRYVKFIKKKEKKRKYIHPEEMAFVKRSEANHKYKDDKDEIDKLISMIKTLPLKTKNINKWFTPKYLNCDRRSFDRLLEKNKKLKRVWNCAVNEVTAELQDKTIEKIESGNMSDSAAIQALKLISKNKEDMFYDDTKKVEEKKDEDENLKKPEPVNNPAKQLDLNKPEFKDHHKKPEEKDAPCDLLSTHDSSPNTATAKGTSSVVQERGKSQPTSSVLSKFGLEV